MQNNTYTTTAPGCEHKNWICGVVKIRRWYWDIWEPITFCLDCQWFFVGEKANRIRNEKSSNR